MLENEPTVHTDEDRGLFDKLPLGACGGPQNPGGSANPSFSRLLLPVDLTRGGTLFPFNGHPDIKLFSLYLQDAITKGNWSFNVGLRGDLYNGPPSHKEAELRLGIAYNIKHTNTVLRASYARVLVTPFDENLVLSSTDRHQSEQ